MRVVTPEINWHGRDPVYSVDFQHGKHKLQRMATCGTDRHVRIWEVHPPTGPGELGAAGVDFLASLSRHTRTVNVVRFSPNGEILASAGDDCVIILWRLNETAPPANNIFAGDEEGEESRENWTAYKNLRSHLEDVYDISWSIDSSFLLSGSVDNSAIMWDVKKGSRVTILPDHKSFVQGVAFDPQHKYLATMSSDRCCRVFSIASKNCVSSMTKLATAPTVTEGEVPRKTFRMFHDDTMKSFFRRLSFSPDGNLLACPAGCLEADTGEQPANTTYIFSRYSFNKPALHLPGPSKATLAVRFCPTLFNLRKVPRCTKIEASSNKSEEELKEWEKYETIFNIPYRMVFAVVTEDSVLFYDTQQAAPFGFVGNIHYHQLSDLSWTETGSGLAISSTDGYVTLVNFAEGELGEPYKDQIKHTIPVQDPAKTSGKTKKGKDKLKTPVEPAAAANPPDSTLEKPCAESLKTPVKPANKAAPSTPSSQEKKAPRRIQVTTLCSLDESPSQSPSPFEVMHAPPTPKSSSAAAPRTPKSSLASSPMTPKSSTQNAGNAKGRRIKVTTLETYTPEESPPSARKSLEPVTCEDSQSADLHLVLDTDTALDVEDVKAVPSLSNASASKEKPKARRIQVTTLETFDT